MRIGTVPAIDLTAGSPRDSVKIQAENLEVIRAVRAINASGNLGDTHELVFFLDRETRRPVIKLVNRISKEMVREIPSNRILSLSENLKISG